MRHYYYTICSRNYLYKGLALYETMKENDLDFKFYCICLDDDCVSLVKKLNPIDLVPIGLSDLFKDEQESVLEECSNEGDCTLAAIASVALNLFEYNPNMDHLTWVDCEIGFFGDTNRLYNLWRNASLLLIGNQGSRTYNSCNDVFSSYSKALIGFKKDEICMSLLKDIAYNPTAEINWQQAIENASVIIDQEIFINPLFDTEFTDIQPDNKVPVTFYFNTFRYFDGQIFDLCSSSKDFKSAYNEHIYMPYIEKCKQVYERVESVESDFYPDLSYDKHIFKNYFNYNVNVDRPAFNLCTICNQENILQVLALYHSIIKHNCKFRLWVCCNDAESFNYLRERKLSNLLIINQSDFEGAEIQSVVQKVRLIRHIMKNNYKVKQILYVDPNYYFLESPKLVFDRMKKGSIFLFKSNRKNRSSITNSMLAVKRNETSIRCIEEISKGTDANMLEECFAPYDGVEIIDGANINSTEFKKSKVRFATLGNKLFLNKDLLIAFRFEHDGIQDKGYKSMVNEILSSRANAEKTIYLKYFKTIKYCMSIINNNR